MSLKWVSDREHYSDSPTQCRRECRNPKFFLSQCENFVLSIKCERIAEKGADDFSGDLADR